MSGNRKRCGGGVAALAGAWLMSWVTSPASGLEIKITVEKEPVVLKAAEVDTEVSRHIINAVDLPDMNVAATSQPATSSQQDSGSEADPVGGKPGEWLSDLERAKTVSRQVGRPIFVRVGAEWCGWCKKLEAEMKTEAVQKALENWVCVELNVDRQRQEAAALSVGPIPALRLLTASGKVAASHDGFLPADELISWMQASYERAAVVVPGALMETDAPAERDIVKLISQLDHADALLREAAIERLRPFPGVAVEPVSLAFVKGNLAVRLSCLDILTSWDAPVASMDPWRPETLPQDKLEALLKWAKEYEPTKSAPAEELSAGQLEQVRLDLARLLRVESRTEAEAGMERLARWGSALLPEIYAHLERTASEEQRELLCALRYRVVASRRLALEWPNGFLRLASTDAETRRKAIQELAQQARPDTAPLLLELFSHPDSLVREISLQTLRRVGGDKSVDALVRLLRDPEPNVRAAVLNQLRENPARHIVPELAEYVAHEQDADLVVHAIRALRAGGGQAALSAVLLLAEHPTWQVRAEVAEAISEILNNRSDTSAEGRSEAVSCLLKLLDDEDGFVVSRAMEGLQNTDLGSAPDAVAAAVDRHPELASQLLEAMTYHSGDMDALATQLRTLSEHSDPRVRAAAIRHLAGAGGKPTQEVVLAGLRDENVEIRIATAAALFESYAAFRDEDDYSMRMFAEDGMDIDYEELDQPRGLLWRVVGGLLGGGSRKVSRVRVATTIPAGPSTAPAVEDTTMVAVDTAPAGVSSQPAVTETPRAPSWITRFHAGQGRPEWLGDTVVPLQKMLSSESADERLAAALALSPLIKGEALIPVLVEAAGSSPDKWEQVSSVLPWMLWEDRARLFGDLLAVAEGPDQVVQLASMLVEDPDDRAAPLLWPLFERAEAKAEFAAMLQWQLRAAYLGNSHRGWEALGADRQRRIADDLKANASSGSDVRRACALELLVEFAPAEAEPIAVGILDNPQLSVELRSVALRAQLLVRPEEEAARLAVGSFSRPENDLRKLGLLYFVNGREGLQGMGMMAFVDYSAFSMVNWGGGSEPIKPEAPRGLEAEQVMPLLESSDAEVRAHAGYLLALLGKPDGMDHLAAYWQVNDADRPDVRRLVYRAVAALGDDARVPLLEQIYKTYDREDYYLRDFYWTIRSMQGEKVFELRKRIRDEVGMANLR